MTASTFVPFLPGNRNPKASTPTRSATRIVSAYLVVAGLWIGFSDRILFTLVSDRSTLARVETLKGWLFVAVTAAGLFWILRAKLDQRREDEEKLKLFVEQAPVALAMLDRELRYVMTSRRWRADFNLDARDLMGVRHYDVFPNLPENWRAIHRRALNGETVHDDLDVLTCADGKTMWLRREVRPWLDGGGKIGGIVIFAEDVSARKKTEDALTDSQERLRIALAAGRVSTWTWSVAQDRIDYDEGVLRLMGRTREEIARGGIEFFQSCVHPEDRTRLNAAIAKAMASGTEAAVEYRIVRPDGTTVWIIDRGVIERDESGAVVRMTGACVDVTESKRMQQALAASESRFREVVETIGEVFWISDVRKDQILYVSPAYEKIWGRPCADLYASGRAWLSAVHPDDRERVRHAALTQQTEGTYDEIYRVVRPDGSIRWIRDLAYPVKDAQGALMRIVGCARDITERKQLEEQFLRAQRLEAIGTLASGVAHDLNNILAPMLMVGPILKEKLATPEDASLLGIAGERGLLQVRHLVKEMTAIMNETFPREIGIVHQVPSDLWPVMGDATQLHQVLMNLCVNARDAMAEGGKLSIDARNAELGAAELEGHPGVQPGRFVVVTISDTGHGIPQENQAKIFEPFFTTKEIGKGTGLGLSTVLGIVKSHGGFITLESHLGRGTTFHVYLPSAEATDLLALPMKPSDAAPGHGELVLIVDDEVNVRQAMQRVLEHNAYRVLTAANGREALGLYLLQREQVRVVVTDLMMPEMNGIALIRALRDLSPTLPILAATGLIDEEKQNAVAAMGVAELLPKPYTSFELIDALGRALAATPSPAGESSGANNAWDSANPAERPRAEHESLLHTAHA